MARFTRLLGSAIDRALHSGPDADRLSVLEVVVAGRRSRRSYDNPIYGADEQAQSETNASHQPLLPTGFTRGNGP